MTTAISSGMQGYDRAEAMVNHAATQIANFPSSPLAAAKPGIIPADSTDLSTAAVSLIEGKNSADANLGTIHVADQMQKSLIDMLG